MPSLTLRLILTSVLRPPHFFIQWFIYIFNFAYLYVPLFYILFIFFFMPSLILRLILTSILHQPYFFIQWFKHAFNFAYLYVPSFCILFLLVPPIIPLAPSFISSTSSIFLYSAVWYFLFLSRIFHHHTFLSFSSTTRSLSHSNLSNIFFNFSVF